MHIAQEKLLKLLDTQNVSGLTLRQIGGKIGETGSPQKIKHHLDQLAKRGLIKIDRQNNTIEKTRGGLSAENNLVSLPIVGSANCGEATYFADGYAEGYLKASKTVLGDLVDKINNLFVLRAVGSSMNRAYIDEDTIEDGDFVIVDKTEKQPRNGEYVVSIIDGVANIKKLFLDDKNQRVVLVSESNEDLPPIYIHQDDLDSYFIAGRVVKVMKQPDELADFRNAAMADALKGLGDISKEEYDYYENLCLPKEK